MHSRRAFLASGAAAFPMIVPSRVLGKFAPSNIIQVAQIGCGRIARGSEFAGIFKHAGLARFVAVCDLDAVRAKDAKQLVDRTYTEKLGAGKFAEVKVYGDYREVLEDKSIDAVCISTPDHWHAQPTIEAALAGMEKPTPPQTTARSPRPRWKLSLASSTTSLRRSMSTERPVMP